MPDYRIGQTSKDKDGRAIIYTPNGWVYAPQSPDPARRIADALGAGGKAHDGSVTAAEAAVRASRAADAKTLAKTATKPLRVLGPVFTLGEAGFGTLADVRAGQPVGRAVLRNGAKAGGSWAGAAAGGTLGVELGLLTGPAAPIAAPVLGVGGAILGGIAGEEAVEALPQAIAEGGRFVRRTGRQVDREISLRNDPRYWIGRTAARY